MTDIEFQNLVFTVFSMFRNQVPIDTGNMRYNATQLEKRGDDWIIRVDGSIAPYAVDTNEPWISERWKGKKNPNEHWVENAFDMALKMIYGQNGAEMHKKK